MLKRIQEDTKVQLLIVGLLCIVAYGNTLKHGFVLDDQSAILENTLVKKGVSGIPEIWTHSYMYGYSKQNDETYRPLPLTVFAFCYELFGENATGYHVIQVLLYLLLSILVLFYLKRLLRDFHPLYPLLITLIFCVHPIHTEVVANIKSADEILSLLFGIAALHFILKALDKSNVKFILFAILTYFLAITSKETAVTLIILFPLQFWFFRDISFKKILASSSAIAFPFLAYFLIRYMILDNMTFEDGTYKLQIYNNSLLAATDSSEFVGTAFIILKYYLKLIFIPTNLSYDYSFNVFHNESLSSLNAISSVLIYLCLGGIALFGLIRKWSFSFGLILFLAVISIYSNLFVKIGASCGERFLFTPLLGLILFVVLAIDFIQKKKSIPWLKTGIVSVVSIGLIGLFTSMTISRNSDWKTDESLFLTDVEKVPDSFRANLFAASVYREKANNSTSVNVQNTLYRKALKHLKAVYKIYPEFDDTYLQMAQVYRSLNEWEKMKTVSKAGLKLDESKLILIALLAESHLNLREFDECRNYFLILENSNDTLYKYEAKYNMGASYLNEQNFDSAIVWFEKIIEFKPDDISTNYYLAMSYFQVGKLNEAIQFFSKVPNTHETYAHSQSSIGTIYLLQEEYENALIHLNNALLVVPGDENILNNMIVAYQSLGQLEKAKECAAMINSPNAAPGLQ